MLFTLLLSLVWVRLCPIARFLNGRYVRTRTRTVSCSATEYGPFGQINNSACVASAAPCAWDYEIDVCCSTNVSKPDPRGGVMCPCVESCCAHQYSEPKISRLAVAAYDEATKICQTSGSGQQCTPFEDTLAPGWIEGGIGGRDGMAEPAPTLAADPSAPRALLDFWLVCLQTASRMSPLRLASAAAIRRAASQPARCPPGYAAAS